MQTAIMYVVITLLMSGVLVGFGLPFIASHGSPGV